AARPAAGTSSARYFQGYREGGCRHDCHAGCPGSGFARWLRQKFVRRHEYCDHAKRCENHSVGSRAGGLWPGNKRRPRAVARRRCRGDRNVLARGKDVGSGMTAFERANAMEMIQAKLRSLTPTTDAQRQLLSQAEQISNDMLQARWLLIEQAQSALPVPFLVVLLFWLTMLFLSFGLFAPRNATVIIVLLIGAMSVSGAIFIILEMNHPLRGMIKVSSAPMRKALEHLGR